MPSMPGSITLQRTLVSSTSICAVTVWPMAVMSRLSWSPVQPDCTSARRREYGPAACGYCWRCAAGPRPCRACAAGRRRWAAPSLRQWAAFSAFQAALRRVSCRRCGGSWPCCCSSRRRLPLRSTRVMPSRRRQLSRPSRRWNPAAHYITIGQDEPGYRSWYLASAAARGGR